MNTSRKCSLIVAIAALTVAAASPGEAGAVDLLQAYQQARQSDPVLAKAQAQDLATQAAVGQARAPLLPHLSGSYGYSQSRSHNSQTGPADPANNDFQLFTSRSQAKSYGTTFGAKLSQTLFDFGAWTNLKSSKSRADAQDAVYRAAQENLMVRVAQAYFNVLTTHDQLRFAKAQEKSLAKQLDQAQARYEAGLSAILDVNEAKASHDAATANVIQAENSLDDAHEALIEITGEPFQSLEVLRENLPMNPPVPNNQQAWVDEAVNQNPQILAQRFQVEAAEHSIASARSERLPTLGASISYNHNPGWGDNFGGGYAGWVHNNSNRESTTIGITLNIPLFSGGAIRSQIQQSVHQRDAAKFQLEDVRRQAVRNTRSAYRSVIAGISEVKARKQAVISAQSALEATQAGYKYGTRNIVDVFNSQQHLFQARSNYSRARHQFIINKLLLKQSAGSIDYDDLQSVNALLVPENQTSLEISSGTQPASAASTGQPGAPA